MLLDTWRMHVDPDREAARQETTQTDRRRHRYLADHWLDGGETEPDNRERNMRPPLIGAAPPQLPPCGSNERRPADSRDPVILSGVSERIHDDEPDTSEPVVRALLQAECPQWASSPIEYLKTSGTDNAMWRIRVDGDADLVMRLPRRPGAAAGVLYEVAVLRLIKAFAIASVVRTPTVRHVGEPHEAFAHHWSVLEWIEGTDCWSARDRLDGSSLATLATDLAAAVVAVGKIPPQGIRPRAAGSRGGPLHPLLQRLDRWLTDPAWNARDLVDVAAVRRVAAEGLEVADDPVSNGFVHGDLIPGNLLIDDSRLWAIIDWGGAGCGDPAQDYAPAWAVLAASARPAFRAAVGADDAAWIRGRTFELEHAVGGVLYYVPKRHPLGDVMSRTLRRILDDS